MDVACGSVHTVLLRSDGEALLFGSETAVREKPPKLRAGHSSAVFRAPVTEH